MGLHICMVQRCPWPSIGRFWQGEGHRGSYLQGKNVDAARGLAFLINGNITISGGCPNPALDAETATQVSHALRRQTSAVVSDPLEEEGVLQSSYTLFDCI